jgi:hypothetical protein
MMTILAAALMWQEATPGPFIDGLATFYSKGTMEQVAHNRGISLDGAVDYVAMNRAGDLHRLVWIEYEGRLYGPYRVADCAGRGRDYQMRERLGRIVEVSWEQAQAWEMRGPGEVRVWLAPPFVEPPEAM